MSALREAAQQALEALKRGRSLIVGAGVPQVDNAIAALRAALAEPEQTFMAEYKFRSFGWYPDADGKMQLGEIPKSLTDAALLNSKPGQLKDREEK